MEAFSLAPLINSQALKLVENLIKKSQVNVASDGALTHTRSKTSTEKSYWLVKGGILMLMLAWSRSPSLQKRCKQREQR